MIKVIKALVVGSYKVVKAIFVGLCKLPFIIVVGVPIILIGSFLEIGGDNRLMSWAIKNRFFNWIMGT